MAETKKCEVCEQEIGATEKVCPKCGADFEELEEHVKSLDRAQKVLEKRRKAALPPEPQPEPKPVKRSLFSALASKGNK